MTNKWQMKKTEKELQKFIKNAKTPQLSPQKQKTLALFLPLSQNPCMCHVGGVLNLFEKKPSSTNVREEKNTALEPIVCE